MRDYKNVKVPKKYRTQTRGASVKRVETGRARKGRKGQAGLKKIIVQILGFAAITAFSWFGWQAYGMIMKAEMFQIAGVDVTGVHEIGEAELKKFAGEFTGENIFRADIEVAVRRARANPWIKDVRIHRRLPNRITMEVTERAPCALLCTDAGRFLMDREAVVIGPADSHPALARSLPVISIKNYRALPGEPVTAESITDAMTLLAEIEARGGWQPENLTIKAASPEAISIVYADHEFKIGSGNYSQKLRRIAEIMADVKERGIDIAYADVRAERQAAVMVKGKMNAGAPERR